MLSAEDHEERIAAAIDLLAVNGSPVAYKMLLETMPAQSVTAAQGAAHVLPWLPWSKRRELFQTLRKVIGDSDQLAPLIRALNQTPDRRAADVLWEIVDGSELTENLADVLVDGLQTAYGGRSRDLSNLPKEAGRAAAAAARQRTTDGGDLRRLVGLSMMHRFDIEAAATAARAIVDDIALSAPLRLDAYKVLLGSLSVVERQKVVQEAIVGADVQRKKIALGVLVFEGNDLVTVRGIDFPNSVNANLSFSSSNGQIIVPKAPRGITVEQILPLLADSDQETAAKAAYLLALLCDGRGLNELVTYWREYKSTDAAWSRLVYRAVSVMDDSSHIDILERIYTQLNRWSTGDFYWTIRGMTGGAILALRKRIRQEVGMEALR